MKSWAIFIFALALNIVLPESSARADQLLTPEQNARAEELARQGSADASSRAKVLTELGQLLESHRDTDEDAMILAALLDLSADRESFQNDPLTDSIEKLKKAGIDAVTPEAWVRLKREIEHRIEHVLKGLDTGKLDLKSAERLLAIAKYAVDAWVEAGKKLPSGKPDPHTDRLFRILNRLHGIVSTAKGLQDPSAKDLLEGVRDTLAEYRAKIGGKAIPSHLDAIEVPAAVSGAIIDHNRKALNEISDVLKHLPNVMRGDERALEQMLEGTKKVEGTISRRAYGRAMWNALTDRVIDRIPFARSAVTWFGTDIDFSELTDGDEKGVVWSTSWGKIIIGDGKIRPAKGSFMENWGGSLEAGYLSGSRIVGSYELTHPSVAKRGVFEWKFTDRGRKPGGPPMHFEGNRFQQEPPKGTPEPWSGSR